MTMTIITERKRLMFNRLSYAYVGGYNVYMTQQGEREQFLTYITNPLTPNLEEHLLSRVKVTEGYIDLPKEAHHDAAYPPKVLWNNKILNEDEFSYSPYLKQVKLSAQIQPTAEDVVDLIYYQDSVVYDHYVEHEDQIQPIHYRVEPIYRNTHLIGGHNHIQ